MMKGDYVLHDKDVIEIHVRWTNSQIADVFERLADLLEISGANPFRVRAYRNAARTLSGYPESLADHFQEQGKLPTIAGVGEDLAEKIRQLLQGQKLALLEELEAKIPAGVLALLKVPGLQQESRRPAQGTWHRNARSIAARLRAGASEVAKRVWGEDRAVHLARTGDCGDGGATHALGRRRRDCATTRGPPARRVGRRATGVGGQLSPGTRHDWRSGRVGGLDGRGR